MINYQEGITLFAFVIILILSIVAAAEASKGEPFQNIETFASLNFPKMGDALESGWYRTLGKECKPNLYKCKAKEQTWCSKRKDCEVPFHHLKGKLMKEPMSWFDRFV